jgi:hypothetical protein
MADGLFYVDSRMPYIVSDPASVTLAATDSALIPVGSLPVLGSNYFGFVGKAVRCTMYGRITTAVTPGNGTFDIYWGNGTSANGTIILSSAAFALTASQTNITWELQFIVRCRAIGTAGTVMSVGMANFNPAVVASTLQTIMLPATAPAAVTIDTTLANFISPQFKRSGSTAETMQVHEFLFEALN